jgi:hypothetical protein
VLETLTNLPHDAIERITERVTHQAKRSVGQTVPRTAAQLAAVSFPYAITDAVAASSTGSPTRHAPSTDRAQTRRRGRPR